MLSTLNYITWNVSPWLYEGEHFAIGWYGTLVITGFVFLLLILLRTFKHDGVPEQYAYITFGCVLVFGLVFAHLADSIFYNWEYTPDYLWSYLGIQSHYYNERLLHPASLLSLSHGGFASHGLYAAMLIVSICLAKLFNCSKWYLADRIFIGIWLLGVFVRTGNLINGEIIGIETTMPWGIIYNNTEPLHPTQIYEALIFLSSCIIAFGLFYKKDGGKYNGLITGVTLFYTAVWRIIVELLKQPQYELESDWLLNMGQLLSIPYLILGVWMWYQAIHQGLSESLSPTTKLTRAERRRMSKEK